MCGHWCWSPEGLFMLGSSSSTQAVPRSKVERWVCVYTHASEHVGSTFLTTCIAFLWASSQVMPQGCPLAMQTGNHVVACRVNTPPLLLLWCSWQGAYSSDYFLRLPKFHVLHAAGMAKARVAATACAWAVQTGLGAMERSCVGQRWDMDGALTSRQPCSKPVLAGCYRDAKVSSWTAELLSKLNGFEMRPFLHRESSKPWEQIVTDKVSLLPPLENVNKSWVSFRNICPASSSYCRCYDWVVQILMKGGIFLLCDSHSHTTASTAASFCRYNRLICQSRDTHQLPATSQTDLSVSHLTWFFLTWRTSG